jgi:putative flippase GtrA
MSVLPLPVPNALRRDAVLGRAARSMLVSIGTTLQSAVVLVVLAIGLGMNAALANVIAVASGIPASYLGNRRWAWGRRGRGSIAHEAMPFWVLCITGMLLSSLAVDRAAARTAAWSTTARAIALPAANLFVFGSLWLVQFVVLDRVIFRGKRPTVPVVHDAAPADRRLAA